MHNLEFKKITKIPSLNQSKMGKNTNFKSLTQDRALFELTKKI
jgi:hypothetical protein